MGQKWSTLSAFVLAAKITELGAGQVCRNLLRVTEKYCKEGCCGDDEDLHCCAKTISVTVLKAIASVLGSIIFLVIFFSILCYCINRKKKKIKEEHRRERHFRRQRRQAAQAIIRNADVEICADPEVTSYCEDDLPPTYSLQDPAQNNDVCNVFHTGVDQLPVVLFPPSYEDATKPIPSADDEHMAVPST